MENFIVLPQEQMICVYGGDKADREKRRAARKARREERKKKKKKKREESPYFKVEYIFQF